jgi:hypothetical protein
MSFYGLAFVGLALELFLVGRLLYSGLWRPYSYFFSYAVYALAGTLAIFGTLAFSPGRYAVVYWTTESISIVLRFLVVWEVYRHTFPRGSAPNRVVSKRFAVIVLALAILSIGSFWSYATYPQSYSIHAALDRSLGFAQAVMILGMLFAARYYGIQFGRNIWGIAVALGAYASISTANNALIDLAHSFHPYWRVLSPLSFVGMLGVWTWAVWVEARNPAIVAVPAADLDAEFGHWVEGWKRTTSTARRFTNP